jgi:uncharacterized spore protein YtfJ
MDTVLFLERNPTMTDTYEEAIAAASANTHGAGLVERLAERVGMRATSETVFGAPVERDGVTVIPVARVRWGVGGGSGSGHDESGHREGEGGGGGGGASAMPVGFIEIAGGEAHFRRIVDYSSLWPTMLVGGLAGWLLLRGLRSIFR